MNLMKLSGHFLTGDELASAVSQARIPAKPQSLVVAEADLLAARRERALCEAALNDEIQKAIALKHAPTTVPKELSQREDDLEKAKQKVAAARERLEHSRTAYSPIFASESARALKPTIRKATELMTALEQLLVPLADLSNFANVNRLAAPASVQNGATALAQLRLLMKLISQ